MCAGAMDAPIILWLLPDSGKALGQLDDGAVIHLQAHPGPEQKQNTWNAVGILRGTDPALGKQAVLLTAHLDHLGIAKPVNGDDIYNAADDDASTSLPPLQLPRP